VRSVHGRWQLAAGTVDLDNNYDCSVIVCVNYNSNYNIRPNNISSRVSFLLLILNFELTKTN